MLTGIYRLGFTDSQMEVYFNPAYNLGFQSSVTEMKLLKLGLTKHSLLMRVASGHFILGDSVRYKLSLKV